MRVAMHVFSERGFRGTTTKEIAQAAGISEAIIFRHFATKEELYAAILDHKACAGDMSSMCNSMADAIRRCDDRAVFVGLATAMLDHHERDPEFPRLLLYSALEGHSLAEMFWSRNVREMAEFLLAYVRDRQRAGVFRAMDPRIVGRALMGMVIHHSLVNLLFDKTRSLIDISNRRAAESFTDILLNGIRTTGGPANGKPPGATAKPRQRKKQ